MNVSEYFVDFLIEKGVTDVFGIPGGVILDLIYEFNKRTEIKAHLSYHEQAAAFEACGYSQCDYKLGGAYATRGPGFTNMITGIAEAFSESLPILFVTSHSGKIVGHSMRFEKEQEVDTASMVRHITKYAVAIDSIEEVVEEINKAYIIAMEGRKGPVLLDFSADLWNQKLNDHETENEVIIRKFKNDVLNEVIKDITKYLLNSQRPIILVGDGVRQAGATEMLKVFADDINVPVLSSRCSQDVGAQCNNYYGYIGSHGIRYSNFIFAKADLVIAIGNRLAFPITSKSFIKALANKRVLRIDVDSNELSRNIPNSVKYEIDAKVVLEELINKPITVMNHSQWIEVCNKLKFELKMFDLNLAIKNINCILNKVKSCQSICCDVGNNEFWVSRSYVESKIQNRIIYSKSFGALGCSIAKAIGAYYFTKKPVVCFIGDQGFQLNVQELQLIAQNQLPIYIIVLNNNSSGMIRSREKTRYGECYVHTTCQSGYSVPDIMGLAQAYGIQYCEYMNINEDIVTFFGEKTPLIVEVKLGEEIDLEPNLPAGNDCENMSPEIPYLLYKELDKL